MRRIVRNKKFVFGKGFVEKENMKKENIEIKKEDVMSKIEKEVATQKANDTTQDEPRQEAEVIEPTETKEIKPLYQIINEKTKEFNGNMKKVQDFAVNNYQGEDLFSAGYQVCMIMTNNRLQVESIQRKYLKNILEGDTEIPFDPREETILSKIIKSLNPTPARIVTKENQDVLDEIKKLIEKK